jgi:hypothetical protein
LAYTGHERWGSACPGHGEARFGHTVVLRWVAWFNIAGRLGLVARAVVRSARWSMAKDLTTQRGKRAERSKMPCAMRSHDGSARNDAAATVDEGE